MFGRATIRLGIGPHSSCSCVVASDVLRLVSSALSQDTGWEERLGNDLFRVEWDVKPKLNQWCILITAATIFCAVTMLTGWQKVHLACSGNCVMSIALWLCLCIVSHMLFDFAVFNLLLVTCHR